MIPFSPSYYFWITFRTCSDDIHASAPQVLKSPNLFFPFTTHAKKIGTKKQNNIKQDGMNITHTKVLEPKKQNKNLKRSWRRCGIWQGIPTYSSLSYPSCSCCGSLVVGWIWVVAKKEKSKNLERHSSFIIRVVNFMTGWIPDSPPPSPLSYFSLFHFFFSTTNPFFSLSPFFVVVLLFLSSMSISYFLCLLTVGFLLSIWFLFALQFRQDLKTFPFWNSGIERA